VDGWVKIYSS